MEYIACIGIDVKQHICLPDSNYCKCGVKVLRKDYLEMIMSYFLVMSVLAKGGIYA